MALLKHNLDSDSIKDAELTKYVVVTGGFDYVTIDAEETSYLEDVRKASANAGLNIKHLEVTASPKLAKALGVSVVPSLVLIEDGEVSGTLVGACSTEQAEAFLVSGVSPL